MIDTLKVNMIDCLKTYDEKVELEQDMDRKEWISKYNSQLIVTIVQLLWTREVEKAFERKRVSEGLIEVRDVIDEYLTDYRILMNGKLDKMVRKRIIAIITGEVHNQDVVRMLIDNKVLKPNDFNWQKQLR
jgi:dynein heavy chain